MIQMNGFLVDARILKREFQEEALRKGLIRDFSTNTTSCNAGCNPFCS